MRDVLFRRAVSSCSAVVVFGVHDCFAVILRYVTRSPCRQGRTPYDRPQSVFYGQCPVESPMLDATRLQQRSRGDGESMTLERKRCPVAIIGRDVGRRGTAVVVVVIDHRAAVSSKMLC